MIRIGNTKVTKTCKYLSLTDNQRHGFIRTKPVGGPFYILSAPNQKRPA
jgi:hypothetical protein